jgi:hypothetical protein
MLRWHSQLQGQSGVVSREQARDAGYTAKSIEWRLRAGSWRRLHLGVYATFTGIPSREATLWAAVLAAGPGAALSHETAAELHELLTRPVSQIHLSVPATRQPGRDQKIRGVIIHRSRCLVPEWQAPWQLPRTSGSARRSLAARGCAGGRGSPPPSRTLRTAFTRRWKGTTFPESNASTACPRLGGRLSAGTAARRGTWTTCTRSMASASSLTEPPPIRLKAAGAICTGIMTTSCREWKPSGTAGRTPPSIAAGPPPKSAHSCVATAGKASSVPAAPVVRLPAGSCETSPLIRGFASHDREATLRRQCSRGG